MIFVSMGKTLAIVTICLAGGFAAARWLAPVSIAPAESRFWESAPSSRPLVERLLKLENALNEERQARQLLQDELVYLTEEIESLRAVTGEIPGQPVATTTSEAVTVSAAASRRERVASRNSPEYRIQRLVDAGISPERAEWILQREDQSRLAQMEARYEAQRSGERADYRALRQAEAEAFRNELGAADYERYLKGTGRSTSVVVGSVLDTSPAQNVGIQSGDEIVSYAGTRVYNLADLNRIMLEGAAGETVTAQIVRDGVTMQVAVRRGPLGITAARGGRR